MVCHGILSLVSRLYDNSVWKMLPGSFTPLEPRLVWQFSPYAAVAVIVGKQIYEFFEVIWCSKKKMQGLVPEFWYCNSLFLMSEGNGFHVAMPLFIATIDLAFDIWCDTCHVICDIWSSNILDMWCIYLKVICEMWYVIYELSYQCISM